MMKRALTVALLTGATLLTIALPAWAKGGETTGATLSLSGPGLGTPLSVSGKEGLKVAHWAGAMNLAGGVAAAPNISLGQKYIATYTVGCASVGTPVVNQATLVVTQDVYPFAAGGPWTYMAAGQNRCDGGFMPGGWLATGPAFLDLLVQDGFPRSAPVAAPAAPLATPAHAWNPWVFLLAAALTLLLATGAVSATRGWRRPQRVAQ